MKCLVQHLHWNGVTTSCCSQKCPELKFVKQVLPQPLFVLYDLPEKMELDQGKSQKDKSILIPESCGCFCENVYMTFELNTTVGGHWRLCKSSDRTHRSYPAVSFEMNTTNDNRLGYLHEGITILVFHVEVFKYKFTDFMFAPDSVLSDLNEIEKKTWFSEKSPRIRNKKYQHILCSSSNDEHRSKSFYLNRN